MSHLRYHPYICPYCDVARSVKSFPIKKHVMAKHPGKEVRSLHCVNEEIEKKIANSYFKLKLSNLAEESFVESHENNVKEDVEEEEEEEEEDDMEEADMADEDSDPPQSKPLPKITSSASSVATSQASRLTSLDEGDQLQAPQVLQLRLCRDPEAGSLQALPDEASGLRDEGQRGDQWGEGRVGEEDARRDVHQERTPRSSHGDAAESQADHPQHSILCK